MPRNAKSASHENRRRAASRNLLEVIGPTPNLYLLDVRPEHFDLILGNDVSVSHPIAGWGEESRKRRHMKVTGMTVHPMRHGLGLRLLDFQRLNIGCRFSFNFENSGELYAGMSSILPHNGFSFVRGTRAWVEDPRGGLVLRCIEPDLLRPHYISATQNGLLSERRGRQLITQTSFGITGLTARTGSGTTTEDGASVFDNTTNGLAGLFKRVVMTAGNPHTVEGVSAWPASRAAVGGGFLSLSIYKQDDPTADLNWKLQRASDGWYWNNTTPAWQAGTVNNALAVNQQKTYVVAARMIPSSATTYTFSAVQTAGGTVSRLNLIHHVQLEEKGFGSSPMPFNTSFTENLPGMRDDDLFQIANDTNKITYHPEHGTMLARFIPKWSTADVDGLYLNVFSVEYDATNYIRLYYDGVTSTKDRLVLEVSNGTSGITALAASLAVTRNVEVNVGVRWASTVYDQLKDEYGILFAGSAWYDLWANSAKIVTGTSAAIPVSTPLSRVQVACRNGENLDAYLLDFDILNTVFSEAEMIAAL